ncbi:MAG TPA: MarR family winged helix-turn-helix transcriptional regulator [Micromonosporaceae bacterium]
MATENDLGWALGAVFRSYVRAANDAVAQLPGGPRGYQVLSAAVHDVPRTQLALAQHLGVDRTVMTYLLDDLVDAGMVERQPDPTDRRARRVVATKRGRAELRRLERRLRLVEDAVLAPLAPGDQQTLRSLLCQVAQHARSIQPADMCQAVAELAR